MSKLLDKYEKDVFGIYSKFPQKEEGDTQPYVSFNLNNPPSMNSFFEDQSNPASKSAVRDADRLLKFSESQKGLIFLGKQVLLQSGNPWAQTRLYNPVNVVLHSVPFVHVPRHVDAKTAIEGFLKIPSDNNGKIQNETWIDLEPKVEFNLTLKGGMMNTGESQIIQLVERGIRSRIKDVTSVFKGVVNSFISPIAGQITDTTVGRSWEDSRPELQYDFVGKVWRANKEFQVYSGAENKDVTYLGQIPVNKFDKYISTDAGSGKFESFISKNVGAVKKSVTSIAKSTVKDISDVAINSVANEFKGIVPNTSTTSVLRSLGLSNVQGVWLKDLASDDKRMKRAGGFVEKQGGFESQIEQYKKDVQSYKLDQLGSQKLSIGLGSAGEPLLSEGISHLYKFSQPDRGGVARKRYFKDFTQQNESILQADILSKNDSDSIDIIFDTKFAITPLAPNITSVGVGSSLLNAKKPSSVRFRAFMTNFQENVTPTYNENKYIGRYEKFYTYDNVDRNVSFILQLVAFSEDELKHIWNKVNYLTSLAYPYDLEGNYIKPTIVDVTIGNIYSKQPCILMGLSHTLDENVSWDIDEQLPLYITCGLQLRVLDKRRYTHVDVMNANKFDIYGKTKEFGERELGIDIGEITVIDNVTASRLRLSSDPTDKVSAVSDSLKPTKAINLGR